MVAIFCTHCPHPHTGQKGIPLHFPLSLTPGEKALPFLQGSEAIGSLTGPCPCQQHASLRTSLIQALFCSLHATFFLTFPPSWVGWQVTQCPFPVLFLLLWEHSAPGLGWVVIKAELGLLHVATVPHPFSTVVAFQLSHPSSQCPGSCLR